MMVVNSSSFLIFPVSMCCQQTSTSPLGIHADAKIFEEFAKEVLPRIKESGYNCILEPSLRLIDGSEIPWPQPPFGYIEPCR